MYNMLEILSDFKEREFDEVLYSQICDETLEHRYGEEYLDDMLGNEGY